MGHTYKVTQWNRAKRRYDLAMVGAAVLYMGVFIGLGAALFPEATAETLLLRALGTAAFLSLHVVLCIGPLARIDRRWLPALYNRRHLGVMTATLGLLHGAFATLQFHAFGDTNPIVSIFTANTRVDSVAHFPFQPLGFIALVILALMAATSHDFWLSALTAPVWKALHMLVYVAYALLVGHVALGILQAESHPALAGLVGLGLALVLGLHLWSARLGRADERSEQAGVADGWVDVGPATSIADGHARAVIVGGERVAVFRDGQRLFALSGVCQHQNGPLAEGRVVDGLAVCPWHGYQYRPECGRSPEPFDEVVPTFRLRLGDGGVVQVAAAPEALGSETEPLLIPGPRGGGHA